MGKMKKFEGRIYISDLHLMDGRSMVTQQGYNHPYFWTSQERVNLLARFLQEEVIDNPDVTTLVIAGDFLDNWVCPVNLVPATFQQIIDAQHNKEVMDKLKIIASPDSPKDLVYVHGNHDLSLDKQVLLDNFPGITVFDGGAPDKTGVFHTAELAAEHGHQYNFFVAPNPDPASLGGHILPIGFFLSRFGAEKKARIGGAPDFWDILDHFLKESNQSGSKFIKNLILSVGKACGLDDNTVIQMGSIDNFGDSITLLEVAELYKDAIDIWNRVKPNGLTAAEAISTELAGLRGAACKYHFLSGKARIAVFGHTHDDKLLGLNRNPDGMFCHTADRNGVDYLYANAGTWTDAHECTFVETWKNSKGSKYYVKLWEYRDFVTNSKKSLKRRNINLD